MTISKLSELSPELAKAEAQFAALEKQEAAIRDRYRKLIEKKASGASPDNQDERVQAVLAGQPIPPPTLIDTEIATELANFNAIEGAKEVLARRMAELKREAGKAHCETYRSAHDNAMKRLAAAMLEGHAALTDLHKIKWTLLNSGSGLYGMFDVDLRFLDNPTNRSSDWADFFRECKSRGFISSIPKELR